MIKYDNIYIFLFSWFLFPLGLLYTIGGQVWFWRTLRICVEVWYRSMVPTSADLKACLHGTCSPNPKSVEDTQLITTDMSKDYRRRMAALLCVVSAGTVMKKRKKRSVWVKEWLQNKVCGSYLQIFSEFQSEDTQAMQQYIRMNPEMFTTILERIRPLISKTDTNMRDAVPAGARLEVTLRYLATGASYGSLEYTSRISKSLLSKIIPETCDAIYKALRSDYLKVSHMLINYSIINYMCMCLELQCAWMCFRGIRILIKRVKIMSQYYLALVPMFIQP